MILFVDTSVWYAALDRADVSHERAVGLLGDEPRLASTDLVLVETWRLAAHRLGFDVAERFWDSLRRGRALLEPVGPADRETAWFIGRRYPDQRFSLGDRTSFAVMERLGLERVAAFDDDFAVYRLGPHEREAFTLVR